MKTTLDLEERILTEAKKRAALEGVSLKALVEDALRARLLPVPRKQARFRLKLPVVRGERAPAVDVADRRVLHDFMEDRE